MYIYNDIAIVEVMRLEEERLYGFKKNYFAIVFNKNIFLYMYLLRFIFKTYLFIFLTTFINRFDLFSK